MKKHAFKNNCHAEPSSASQRFFGCKFLSFRGRSPWNLKNLHPLNDGINHDCHCEECNDEAIHSNSNGLLRSRWSLAMTTGKTAFTLAEVLITLTIIGVIAALTIPNLMQKYKKHQVEVKIKQTYSKLQTAYKTAVTDTGLDAEYWLPENIKSQSNNNKRDYIYNNYFKPYMKTTKWDKTTGVFYDESGIKYTIIDWPVTSTGYRPYIGEISFNITGDKSSQNGKDVFYMMYQYEDKPYGWWLSATPKDAPFAFVECGGSRNDFEKYKNYAYQTGCWPGCISDSSGDRTCCGDIIMRNGWKIPDDYPVKKW